MALTSLFWTPHAPNTMDARHRIEAPSIVHPLGTDQHGRDILSRVMAGAVNSIVVGLITVAIGMGAGVLLGLISAWGGRMIDEAQTFMELAPWMAIFPGLAIAWAVLGFNLLGDGLRDILDPRLR